jgi:alpha-1,2-mannosyltransferase
MGAAAGGLAGADKITVFHRTRCGLALLGAAAETALYAGVRARFGPRVAL